MSLIAILIQARLGSSRMPGKVLMNIAGKPMIDHVVERCRAVPSAGHVMVITTTEQKDDPLADHLSTIAVPFYRGSEHDVLDRYYQAAKPLKADAIVRITSDCPLIDPGVTDRVIRFFLSSKGSLDYASNFVSRTYPRGLDTEIFAMGALERAWQEAVKPHEREHVTPYIYDDPCRFRISNVAGDRDYSHLRWTVDEPRDIAFVRALYERMYTPGKIFDWTQTIRSLEKEPSLIEINREVEQKKVQDRVV